MTINYSRWVLALSGIVAAGPAWAQDEPLFKPQLVIKTKGPAMIVTTPDSKSLAYITSSAGKAEEGYRVDLATRTAKQLTEREIFELQRDPNLDQFADSFDTAGRQKFSRQIDYFTTHDRLKDDYFFHPTSVLLSPKKYSLFTGSNLVLWLGAKTPQPQVIPLTGTPKDASNIEGCLHDPGHLVVLYSLKDGSHRVCFFDPQSGKLLKTISVQSTTGGSERSFDISADGNFLLIGDPHLPGDTFVYDANNGRLLWKPKTNPNFSPTSTTYVGSDDGAELEERDSRTGKLLRYIGPIRDDMFLGPIFSEDGKYFYVCCFKGDIFRVRIQ